MGASTGPIIVLAWMRSLGEMAAHGTRVRFVCTARPCKAWREVDVAEMLARNGPGGRLWDLRPPCPACGAPGHYMASPGGSTPFRPLLSQPGRATLGLED